MNFFPHCSMTNYKLQRLAKGVDGSEPPDADSGAAHEDDRVPAPSACSEMSGGGGFEFRVYTQLARLQRDIGELSAAQEATSVQIREVEPRLSEQIRKVDTRLTEQIREVDTCLTEQITALDGRLREVDTRFAQRLLESENRVVQALKQFEARITARVDKLEADFVVRMNAFDTRLSTLKERVDRIIWVGTGGGVVLGLLYGWKPLIEGVTGAIGT